MPVKVRCGSCGKVVTAPDQARGKAVRCPGCKTPIRVPAQTAAKTKARAAKSSGDDEDFLRNLDVRRIESTTERVCPKCAAMVDSEDIDCPECGVNLETGILGDEQRRIRERVGPDPAMFYGRVWTNSWDFLNNKILAFRTSLYWTLLIWSGLFFGWRTIRAVQRENVSAFGKTFEAGIWGMVSFLSISATAGWYWYLTIRTTQATLERQKKIKDLHFSSHQCMALGVKAVVWPIVLMTPIIWVALPALAFMVFMGAIALGDTFVLPTIFAMAVAGIMAFPYLAFPVAMAHMTMPYTYKAWLPLDMIKLFFKNIGPVLYWWLMAITVTLPFLVIVFLINYFLVDILDAVLPALDSAAMWCASLMVEQPQPEDWSYLTFYYSIVIFIGMILTATFAVPMAFPAVFLARANAMFTYYRSQTLELVTHTKQGEIAGFWVRYLAFMIDQLILFIIFGIYWVIYSFLIYILVDTFGLDGMQYALSLLVGCLCLFTHYRYYVRSETGNSQGTFGKSAIGLIVTNMDGSKVKVKTARKRWFLRTFVTNQTFYLGYLLVLFSKNKQNLHDTMTKTKVVWEGDRE